MHLDLATICLVTALVTALIGMNLLFAWSQAKCRESLAWWGLALIMGTGAMLLFMGRGVISDAWSIGLANALLALCHGLYWQGFRAFSGRGRPNYAVICAGALAWLTACLSPAFMASFDARLIMSSVTCGLYTLACAYELWRGRDERLASRMPLLIVLTAHGLFTLARYPVVALVTETGNDVVYTAPWITMHSFELMLFVVTSSFLMLGMTKDRAEAELRRIASTDGLTGLLNRRAFVEAGATLLSEARQAGRGCAVLLFDVDHFKRVNDRYGHAAGDEVLRLLAAVTGGAMPAGALTARLGGEEFGCLMEGAGPEDAMRAAEILRRGLVEACRTGGLFAPVTISVGISTTREAGHDLERLLLAADANLYRAKDGGRDRVAVTPPLLAAA